MQKTQRRRRKEAKTDYRARLALLKSGKSRLVVRKSNYYITAQLVDTTTVQDRAIARISSKELITKGWPKEHRGSLKSLQAAYLTGYLLGKQYSKKIKDVVFDIGMNRSVRGSRIYAALKGAVDAGLDIHHSQKSLPTEERMKENEKLFMILRRIKEKL